MCNSEATPRSALFRLAAAVAIAEYGTSLLWDDRHDTRAADGIAPRLHYPSECEVCLSPTARGSAYCGEECERIMLGMSKNATQLSEDA